MHKKLFLASFIIIVLFALFQSFLNLDPDFGWHLRTGQLMLETKTIPHTDWYSFSMTDFEWIDHAWLSEILIFLIYEKGGYISLIILFFILALIPFYLFIRKKEIKYYIIPLFLGILSITPYAGVRIQIISWFFIFIIAKIFFDWEWKNKKLFYFLPFLFILWANLHGSFFLGLAIFGFAVFWEFIEYIKIKNKRNLFKISGVFLASALGTLLNPYGYRIYGEIFHTINDSFLKIYIIEWQNFFFKMHWPSIFYMTLFLVLAALFYKRISLKKLSLSIIILTMALMSTRHFPIFVIISFPLFIDLIKITYSQINMERVKKIRAVIISIIIFMFIMSLYLPTFPFVYESIEYPNEKIIEFLRNKEEKRMFNYYGWGGLLIWELPNRKFFIDGRMPSWRQNGIFVFRDYISLSSGKNIEEIIEKYDINQFVIPTKNTGQSIIFADYIPEKILKWLWLKSDEFNLVEYLDKNNEWQKVYQDETAVIFEKK